MRYRRGLRRIHIWLGWLIGVPMLIWTASGLFMASQPIERVRGEHLIRDPAPIGLSGIPVPPLIGPRPVKSLTLEQQQGKPVWIIRYADGGARRAEPVTGRLLPAVTAPEAAAIVSSRYKGESALAAVSRTPKEEPPIEFRRKVEAFRVSYRDGAHFYVDSATGEILARRTGLWRVYDFLWGLHIMDLQTREDINNGWLVGFGVLSLVSVMMALVLLPMSVWKRRL